MGSDVPWKPDPRPEGENVVHECMLDVTGFEGSDAYASNYHELQPQIGSSLLEVRHLSRNDE